MTLAAQLRANITDIIGVFDTHDPGVYPDGIHACPCGFRGVEKEWEQHLADKLAEKLAPAVQLPMEIA